MRTLGCKLCKQRTGFIGFKHFKCTICELKNSKVAKMIKLFGVDQRYELDLKQTVAKSDYSITGNLKGGF